VGSDTLKRIEKPLTELMEDMGVTMESLLRTLSEGLNATKPFIYMGKIYKIPDYDARFKYLHTILRMRGCINSYGTFNFKGKNERNGVIVEILKELPDIINAS
jgi:hypothetical protein